MPDEMDALDRALTDDDTLAPSSGFAARVIEAVQEADCEPPPLAFPWHPFAIGVVACLVWAASVISMVNRLDRGLLREVAAQFVGAGPLPVYAAAMAVATLVLMGFQRRVHGR